jgi:uncharacterized protein YqjF (DUF2071 family)
LELISPFAPRPVPRAVMSQSWRGLTFLHWRYEPEAIRALLPKQLTLDTYDGAAWVGLTPFLLRNLRPPRLPALPWISNFSETNVRTYVRGPDGKRGVWFFTLEAARLVAVVGARALYRLPYRWARMRVRRRGGEIEYESKRRWPFGAARTSIAIHVGGRITAGNFDNFLTARYRLYTLAFGRLAFAEIEHAPWALREGRVLRLEQDLIERSGVPRPRGEPTVHFSENLDVRIGRLRWV